MADPNDNISLGAPLTDADARLCIAITKAPNKMQHVFGADFLRLILRTPKGRGPRNRIGPCAILGLGRDFSYLSVTVRRG